jgi:hypothetical protein
VKLTTRTLSNTDVRNQYSELRATSIPPYAFASRSPVSYIATVQQSGLLVSCSNPCGRLLHINALGRRDSCARCKERNGAKGTWEDNYVKIISINARNRGRRGGVKITRAVRPPSSCRRREVLSAILRQDSPAS